MGLFDVGKAEKLFWEVVGKSKENNLLSKLDRVEAQNLKGSSLVTNLTDKFKDIPIELDNDKLEKLLGNSGMVYLLSTRPHTTSSSNFVKLVKNKVVNSKVLSDYLSNEKPVPMGTPMPNDIKNIKASLIRYLKLTDKEETDQDIVALKQEGASEEDLKIKLKRNKNEDVAEKMQSHRKVNRLKVMVTALLIYLIDRAYGRSQMIFDPAGPPEQPKEPVNKKPSQNSTRTSVQHGTTDGEQDLIEKLANGTATKEEFENLSAEMCDELKKLVIPDGVEEVPSEFYSRLKKLESVTIPGSFKKWVASFNVCKNLKEIIAKEGAVGIINLSFNMA